MKTNILKNLIAVITSIFVFTSCEKETIITESKVPTEIKSYIATHFSNYSILQSVKDKDNFELTYDIVLSNGILLEFNRKKEIIGIDSNSELPQSVIPSKIYSYVNENFANHYITDWEITNKQNQQIELDNKIELLFDKSGNFIRIDN